MEEYVKKRVQKMDLHMKQKIQYIFNTSRMKTQQVSIKYKNIEQQQKREGAKEQEQGINKKSKADFSTCNIWIKAF